MIFFPQMNIEVCECSIQKVKMKNGKPCLFCRGRVELRRLKLISTVRVTYRRSAYFKQLTGVFRACHCAQGTLKRQQGLRVGLGLICHHRWSCGCASRVPLPSPPLLLPLLPPTPFLSPPALRICQLEEFLPLPFHPSENCGLAGDQHTPCRKPLL